MNKKGFAISVILYSIIFLIIAILYMLLGIARLRYNVSSSLREDIISQINEQNQVSLECTIDGSSEFTDNLELVINVQNNDAIFYKFDNDDWSYNNKLTVTNSGKYMGYFKDKRGGIGNCMTQVISKVMYRYKDCLDFDDDVCTSYSEYTDWQELSPDDVTGREIEEKTFYKILE